MNDNINMDITKAESVWVRYGRDRMVVGFKTTCAISAYLAMVFNAIFNNISARSWLSVLLVEETGVPGDNH
jgi:hypothetical protein